MTGRPTPVERAAIKAGYAALLLSESPNSNIVETIVFGLGDRQMLMSPETADELRQLREGVSDLLVKLATARADQKIERIWYRHRARMERYERERANALASRVAELEAAQAAEPRATDGAVAALADAVRALHPKYPDSEHCQHDGEPWPCPTVATIGPAAIRPACGHGVDVRCEDCGRCYDCPDARCESCSICRCSCECAERAGEPAGSPAALVASRLVGMDDVTGVTVDDDTTVTVQVRPRDLDGWRWWLGRFQVPVHTITRRGLVTTARGAAPGGVTVLIVGHGIAKLQAAAIPYITRRGGAL